MYADVAEVRAVHGLVVRAKVVGGRHGLAKPGTVVGDCSLDRGRRGCRRGLPHRRPELGCGRGRSWTWRSLRRRR